MEKKYNRSSLPPILKSCYNTHGDTMSKTQFLKTFRHISEPYADFKIEKEFWDNYLCLFQAIEPQEFRQKGGIPLTFGEDTYHIRFSLDHILQRESAKKIALMPFDRRSGEIDERFTSPASMPLITDCLHEDYRYLLLCGGFLKHKATSLYYIPYEDLTPEDYQNTFSYVFHTFIHEYHRIYQGHDTLMSQAKYLRASRVQILRSRLSKE